MPYVAAGGGERFKEGDPVVITGMGLGERPPFIRVKVFHYRVAPGQAGTNPEKQPVLLDTYVAGLEAEGRAEAADPPAST